MISKSRTLVTFIHELGGGLFLIIGLLTLLATLPILASMLFAILLHLIQGKPQILT
ncbi:hypothetical protein [Nodularia sp. NIES-3585]|uniref:hypothetical protein n=1 Tax=Nodularia sp. NIES-3585 TaxID=1973477 RepID=UPI001C3C95BD|nr:hypothetical protein [Nodularia sp. NIES-3585]